MAANEGQNLIREAVTKIPLYTGDGNDAFTPAQWISRIQKAALAAAWNDENTMSFVYVSLRGKALKWHECLKRSGIVMDFPHFTTAFLESFAPARTARTATVNLHEIKQQPAEDVVGFYSRVIEAIDELELLIPPAARRPAAAVIPGPILNLDGYGALDADVRGFLPGIIDMGITAAFNHVAIQLFVAGLKPAIRDDLMKNMPVILWDAFQQAITLEKVHMPLKHNLPAVNEIEGEDGDLEELDGEIAAVKAHMARLTSRRSQFRPNAQINSGGSPGYRKPATSSSQKGSSQNKDIICRHCKKKGHMQDKCSTRIAKGLPCVDINGIPLKTQPPTPPPRQGRVAEIGNQSAGSQGHSEPPPGTPMPEFMMAPPNQGGGGYWTPYPPNFP